LLQQCSTHPREMVITPKASISNLSLFHVQKPELPETEQSEGESRWERLKQLDETATDC